MRTFRYFLIFALLLFIMLGYKTYEQYQRISHTQDVIVQNETASLGEFISAFRQTYQELFLRYDIPIDDKTLNLLPVKTIQEISQRFSKRVKGDIVVRTVSDRPRNPDNMANAYEMRMIEYFRKHPGAKEHFVQMGDEYIYTKPLYIKESCLKCHGKREETIPSIRQKYDSAYGYKVGDLRGLLSIEVKEDTLFDVLYQDFRNTVITTMLIYLLFLGIIYLLFRKMRQKEEHYTVTLEKEVKNKTAEVEKQRDTFETLFEKASDGILIIRGKRIIECNERAVSLFGYPEKEALLAASLHTLSPQRQPDGSPSSEKIKEMVSLARAHKAHQFEWLNQTASGELFFSDVTITPIVLNSENVLHIVIRDISEKKKAERKLIDQKNYLHYQAHHDHLTGLPNRTLFKDRLIHGIEVAKRQGSMLALLFIDLDHFKHINDTLGHHIGDMVLKVVAERLKAKLRPEDTLARLGGDEFTIIIEDLPSLEEIQLLAERILQVMTQPVHMGGHTLYISCSIGISIYPQDGKSPDHLVKYADAAMYRAKEEGRNNYQFYSKEMTTLAYQRLMLESSMRQAIERDEFIVYYQPQFNAQDDTLVGMEALIRWKHPDPKMGLLSPDHFIPLAAESDLIIEIDRWMMRKAMTEFVAWYERGLEPGRLSLNLSIRQLNSPDYLEVLTKVMNEVNFNPVWLELEVTEGQVMKKPEESIERLNKIAALGIGISIDDFGTGYSSLAYLKRLPVSVLKIDQSFVREIPENKDDTAIVKAIIALAKSLDIGLIAEGVENEAQKLFLLLQGCSTMQGYFYGKPMPGKLFEERFLMKKDQS